MITIIIIIIIIIIIKKQKQTNEHWNKRSIQTQHSQHQWRYFSVFITLFDQNSPLLQVFLLSRQMTNNNVTCLT